MRDWKDIKGYEGYYQISEVGVKSLDRVVSCNGGEVFLKGEMLTLSLNSEGYLKVGLSKGNKLTNINFHILLARAFKPNPNNYPFVRHLNDIKTDNRLVNLEWGTHLDNVADGKRNKVYFSAKGPEHYNYGRKRGTPVNLGKIGIDANNNKIILDQTSGIFYYGTADAAKTYDINPNTLRAMLSGHSRNKTNLIYV